MATEPEISKLIETYCEIHTYLTRLFNFHREQLSAINAGLSDYGEARRALARGPAGKPRDWAKATRVSKMHRGWIAADKNQVDRRTVNKLVRDLAAEAYAEMLKVARENDWHGPLVRLASCFWKLVMEVHRMEEALDEAERATAATAG